MDSIKIDSKTTETKIIDGKPHVIEVTKYNTLSWLLNKRNRIIVIVLLIVFLILMFLTLGLVSVLLPAIIKELTTKKYVKKVMFSSGKNAEILKILGEADDGKRPFGWLTLYELAHEMGTIPNHTVVLNVGRKFYEFMGKTIMSNIIDTFGYFETDFIKLFDMLAEYDSADEFSGFGFKSEPHPHFFLNDMKEDTRLGIIFEIIRTLINNWKKKNPMTRTAEDIASYMFSEGGGTLKDRFMNKIFYLAFLFKLRDVMRGILDNKNSYNRADTYKFLEIYWFVLYELKLFVGNSGDRGKIKEINDELKGVGKYRAGKYWLKINS